MEVATPSGLAEPMGKYRLLEHLGTGGMAEVFLAETAGAQGFQKRVVIKRVLPHLRSDPEFIEMFLDEARLAARLTHPNVVQTFELGEFNGSFFIAMEHVVGKTLYAVIDRLNDYDVLFPLDGALRVIVQLLEALDYAHALTDERRRPLRIVHRDVTPSNVMLTPQGSVKLLDFGIARAADRRHHTQAGVTKGKVGYMAPEHARAERIDGRADVFSVGTLLYILTTGSAPYPPTRDRGEQVQRMMKGRYVAPREANPALDVDLERIILKAMAPRLDARYTSAGEMLREVEAYAAAQQLNLGARAVAEVMRTLFPELAAPAVVGRPTVTVDEPVPSPRPNATDVKRTLSARPLRDTRSDPAVPPPSPVPDEPPSEPLPPVSDHTAPIAVADTDIKPSPPQAPTRARAQPSKAPPSPGRWALLLTPAVAAGAGLAWLLAPAATPAPSPAPPPVAVVVPDEAPKPAPAPEPPSPAAEALPGAVELPPDGPVELARPVVRKAPAAAPPAKKLGVVKLTSEPQAIVRVLGRSYGRTPMRFELPEGMHRLELEYPNNGAKRTLLINVSAGKETQINEHLR
ncbi:MAG: protein kinase [Myxococcaceae bacterium]|nr:protein kinase [Myxococcaceae bacterium]